MKFARVTRAGYGLLDDLLATDLELTQSGSFLLIRVLATGYFLAISAISGVVNLLTLTGSIVIEHVPSCG